MPLSTENKCTLGLAILEYLGHIILANGYIRPYKSEALYCMWLWPTPTYTKGPREFLGLTSFYRCFTHGNDDFQTRESVVKRWLCME